jgi:hypothetical protein
VCAAPSVNRYVEPFSAASISAGIADGSAWNSCAMIPAMCGAAIEVPLIVCALANARRPVVTPQL